MNAGWIIHFIISFALIPFFFAGASLIHPYPLPVQQDLEALPWWAVVGGLAGAVQVYADLTLVSRTKACYAHYERCKSLILWWS